MLKEDILESIENPDDQLAAEAQSGDITAEETLIRKYSYIVTRKAKAFFMAGADADDVVQEGMIGLLKAVRKYDPSKNASFATFAEICVTSQMISAIRSAKDVPLQEIIDHEEIHPPHRRLAAFLRPFRPEPHYQGSVQRRPHRPRLQRESVPLPFA